MQTKKPALLRDVIKQICYMSDSHSNIPLENCVRFSKVVSLDFVSRLRWNIELGEKLKAIRTERKLSRRELAKRAKSSHQFIQDLETGVPESIATKLFLSLCEGLEIETRALIPIADIAISWQQ